MPTPRILHPTIIAALSASAAASATGLPYTVTYDDSFGPGLPLSNSIPNENFAIARNQTLGIEIGTQAAVRFGGTIDNTNERYFAPPGFAPTSPTNPAPSINAAWNINWGVILPTALRDWDVDLNIDFDPGVGVRDMVTLDINDLLDGLGFSAVLSGQNLGAAFWQAPQFGAPPFDPTAPGEYDIDLTVRDLAGTIVAQSAIVVQVVPAPGTMLGLLLAFALPRRR